MAPLEKKHIDDLFFKVYQQRATATELREYYSLLSEEANRIYISTLMLDVLNDEAEATASDNEREDQVWQGINALREPAIVKVKKIVYLRWIAVAAVAILIMLPFVFQFKQDTDPLTIAHVDTVPDPIMDSQVKDKKQMVLKEHLPAREQATLTLFDGEVLSLEKLQVGSRIERDGFILTKLEEGKLEFNFKKLDESRIATLKPHMNTLVTPRGGIFQVRLGDGTKVQLNASSRFTFPSEFNGVQRKVYLDGEALFEVAKDSERQFIVQSGRGNRQQEVVVYGTTFNISAYPGDEVYTTTLVEGSVKLKQMNAANEQFLKPLQQAVSAANGITLGPANLDINLAWANGLFYFADEIDHVMKQLGRWYDVEVVFVGEKVEGVFFGQVSRNRNLAEVLDILSQTNDVKFEIKGKEVLVMRK